MWLTRDMSDGQANPMEDATTTDSSTTRKRGEPQLGVWAQHGPPQFVVQSDGDRGGERFVKLSQHGLQQLLSATESPQSAYYRKMMDPAFMQSGGKVVVASKPPERKTADVAREFAKAQGKLAERARDRFQGLTGPKRLDEIFCAAYQSMVKSRNFTVQPFEYVASRIPKNESELFPPREKRPIHFMFHERKWKSMWTNEVWSCAGKGTFSQLKISLPNDGYIHVPPELLDLTGKALGQQKHHQHKGGWYQLLAEEIEPLVPNLAKFVQQWLPDEEQYTTDIKMSVDHARLDCEFNCAHPTFADCYVGICVQFETGIGKPDSYTPFVRTRINKRP